MTLRLRVPPRRERILAVVLLTICASGLLVYFNVLLAEDLQIVPFLLVGYLAFELLISRISQP